ncbi:MAG: ABC transporter permease [Candidatus Krumholzibacteriia bacterium]|nr:ABC transporter permease [bacterium]MCB9514971.1 ABC transporter permease [Candidatus Latescibacterota bacterium]
MRVAAVLAWSALKEALRDRLLYSLLGLGALLLTVLAFMAPLTLGARDKTFSDVALAWIHASGLLAMLVLGAWSLHREQERGIWLGILTRPVSRQEYLIGRVMGLLGVLALMVGGAALVYLLVAWATGVPPVGHLAVGLLYIVMEMSLLAGMVLLFSTFTGLVMTLFLALAMFAAGHLSADLLRFAELSHSAVIKGVALGAHWVLPHLELYRVRHDLVAGVAPAPDAILGALGYTLLYFTALVGGAAAIFSRREIR